MFHERMQPRWADVVWAEWPVALYRLREEARVESDESFLTTMMTAKMLVLDDIGPTARPTPFALDALAVVVRDRWNNMRPTISTSNYSPDALADKLMVSGYDQSLVDPIIDRVVGMAHERVVLVDGRDRRLVP
jgi:DNA replication protein DnaC